MLSSRPSTPSSLAAPTAPCRHAVHFRPTAPCRHAAAVLQAAAAMPTGGGKLVDPSSGRRRVTVPQKLDPRTLADVRAAPAFGPRGLLLVGFSEQECAAVQSWFQRMEPGFVVTPCPAALLASGTLGDALGSADGGDAGGAAAALPERHWEAPLAGTPPVAFFSGVSGEEQVALMEAWSDCTGLDAPAFASATPSILSKPLARLLMDIVRAQAQAAPPGMDPETVAEVQQARAAGAAAAAVAAAAEAEGPSMDQQPGPGADGAGPAAAAEEGGEEVLKSKLQDYVMLDGKEGQQAAPMSLDQLKQQIQDKMRAKRAQQAAAEKQARRAAGADETDRMRQALRGGKKQQGGKQKKGGGGKGGGKGFGA